ncbi:MAG: M16 family metallopeptidase, partial [Bacteroidia bacterium]
MINRAQAPEFKTIDKVDVIKATPSKLQNGVDLYTIDAGSQEIIKLEFIFKAGMYHQPAALVASATNSLLETGTKSYTANEISDGIDYFGSFIELGVGQDYACITLFSLNKYLNESLKFVEEVIKYPVFSENELNILITNKKQKHQINSQKVSVLARRKFSELLFGEKHPYGIDVQDKDFDRINLNEVQEFYNNFYQSQNCTIIASGHLPKNLNEILNGFFGEKEWGVKPHKIITEKFPLQTTTQRVHLFEKDDALQSAIRIGRILFNKTHPDYF